MTGERDHYYSTRVTNIIEEADTRIMLHLKNASKDGHTKAYVRTVDTDVVILAISFFQQLGLEELWVGFGTGPTYKDIPVHELSKTILVTNNTNSVTVIFSCIYWIRCNLCV